MMRTPFLGPAMMLILLHGAAMAGGEMPLLKLPQGSVQHDLPNSMVVNGIRLQARVLDIAGSMQEVLEDIALQFDPPLQALQHGDGWILADRIAPDWLVILSPRRHRTFAVMSRLSGEPASVPVRPRPPAWLPAGVVQRMALQSDDGERISTQRIFTHSSLPAAQLARQVFAGLARAGWASEGVPQAASSTWVQGNTGMSLSIVSAARGSGILSVMTSPIAAWPGSTEHVLDP